MSYVLQFGIEMVEDNLPPELRIDAKMKKDFISPSVMDVMKDIMKNRTLLLLYVQKLFC